MGLNHKSEQRETRRVAVEMPIRFHVENGEGELAKFHRSSTTNISADGVGFISTLHIPMDARLELEITLPDKSGTLSCTAILLRIARKLPEGEGFEYGVAFEREIIQDTSQLDSFVRSIDIVPLLESMLKEGATDLHLCADARPMVRIMRRLTPCGKRLTAETVQAMVLGTIDSERRQRFLAEKELFFPFMVPGLGRWRVSVFYQRGNIEATFHTIDLSVPTIEELELPEIVRSLALGRGGLIIVTGASGSGKSTTLASMIEAINHAKDRVIITLEDPIQYIHENKKSIVKQREVGTDTLSIRDGLKHVLRQDPDVILLDEIPDSEVLDMALRAAETGHMVLTTLACRDAVSAIKRLCGMYPEERRSNTLHVLAHAIRAVISQRLLPSIDGTELVMIPEVLVVNDSVRQAIRTNKLEQISNLMLGSKGSISLDGALRNAILRGQVDFEHAVQIAEDPEGLRRAVAV
jgi:twitching motility protein PilT